MKPHSRKTNTQRASIETQRTLTLAMRMLVVFSSLWIILCHRELGLIRLFDFCSAWLKEALEMQLRIFELWLSTSDPVEENPQLVLVSSGFTWCSISKAISSRLGHCLFIRALFLLARLFRECLQRILYVQISGSPLDFIWGSKRPWNR